jgi:hypothetical protein
MRDVLCQLADITVETADAVIAKRGFVIPSPPWSGRTIPWSEIDVVDVWVDQDSN